jgi:molybdate transport system substrate-binding protein
MRAAARTFCALALVLAAGACREAAALPAPGGEILVAAASSLRELLESTAPDFRAAHPGHALRFSFEASSTLARQISHGAAFDVFLSADALTIEQVRPALDAATIRDFLSNRLALVRRRGLKDPASVPADLPARSGTIALAGPAVPAGRYARSWLSKAGVLSALEGRIVEADSVRGALAMVESGAADYAFVYRTDANLATRAELAWEDEAGSEAIQYVAAVTRRSTHPGARAYVTWLASERFQAAAGARGFTRPPS